MLPTLALLVGLAPPLHGQNVVLDQGSFRLTRAGAEIGTETFTIRRIGTGDDANVIANAVIELDLPTGREQVRPLLKAAADRSVSDYQVAVSGREPTEVAVTLSGRRFLARTRTPSGEQQREFRATAGSGLLEEDVAHQYWFLSQLAEGTDVTVLVPRAGSQVRVVVRGSEPASIEIAGATVAASHTTFEVEGAVHEVWYDADGRVLRVSVPGTGFAAERTTR